MDRWLSGATFLAESVSIWQPRTTATAQNNHPSEARNALESSRFQEGDLRKAQAPDQGEVLFQVPLGCEFLERRFDRRLAASIQPVENGLQFLESSIHVAATGAGDGI